MALGYGDLFPAGVGADDDFYADQLNFLRTAISRRAAQVGATVTLPAVMADDEPIDLDDELFHNWLDAARTAIEVFIGSYHKYASSTFSDWTKATLLGYVHATWPAACMPSDLADSADWYQYSTAANNEFYIAYLNEIYYVLECCCYPAVATTEYTKTRQLRIGTGTDGSEGGGPLSDGTVTVLSATQSGNFGAAVEPGTASVAFGDDPEAPSIWWSGHDDGAGGWITDSENGCDFVTGSINYATGAWTVTTDFVFPSGGMMVTGATAAAVDGSYATAMANAWTAWTAAGYGATGASWEAKGHLHAYIAYGDTHRKTGVVENYKVTDAQAAVPDVAYPLIELFFPTQRTYMPVSPSPTLAVGSLVGQVEVSTNHYHGWLKVSGDFDNENVQLGGYYFDISSANFHFDAAAPYDEACLFAVSPTGAYGRCGFGGDYCNGAYQPV